jgi:hypothetical protein
MLQRISAMLIVGFWMAMTGMLIVREFYPEATRLNQVPVSYIGRLIFQHNQSSDLQIHDAGKDVGYLHLQPRAFPESKTRSLEYQGKVHINPLGMARQQLSWSGAVVLDEKNDVKSLTLGLSTQEPEHQLIVSVDSEAKTANFVLRSNGQTVDQSSITLDREGVAKLIERIGLDPSLIQQVQSQAGPVASPEITAHQSSTKLNGEVVSTYLVSFKVGGQTLFDAHVSQLGQVLRAEAPLFGYKLAPYNIPP